MGDTWKDAESKAADLQHRLKMEQDAHDKTREFLREAEYLAEEWRIAQAETLRNGERMRELVASLRNSMRMSLNSPNARLVTVEADWIYALDKVLAGPYGDEEALSSPTEPTESDKPISGTQQPNQG